MAEREGMVVDLVVDPPIGVGALTLGMPLAEAQAVMRGMPDYIEAASSPLFADFTSGMSIAVEVDADDHLKSIELYRPDSGSDVRVLFGEIRVFEESAEDVIRELSSVERLDLEEGGRRAVAPELLLTLWRATLPDFPEDEDGRCFESVLVARPGYYENYR